MSDKPVEFNPDALKERVSNHIRNRFGELIPEETFQQLVDDEVRSFFEGEQTFTVQEKKDNSSYRDRTKLVYETTMTPFRQLVWTETRKLINKQLREYFDSEEFRTSTHFNYHNQSYEAELSDMLMNRATELAPRMVAELFKEEFAQSIQNIKADLISDLSTTY